jgi:antitoxin MazE
MATITKWGNSLAIRIPQNLAKQINLIEGSEVELTVIEGKLVLVPKFPCHYKLQELVQGITAENRHEEINYGSVVGQEAW